MKSKLTKQQIIPLVIGLLLSASLLIYSKYYPLTDWLYGLLNGVAIGLIAFALLSKNKKSCTKSISGKPI